MPATQFAVSGLVELLPLKNRVLLSMERSFSVGAPGTGNKIRLYDVSLTVPTTSTASTASRRCSPACDRPRRRSLLDLDELGIPLDNVEGMTFGPNLRDGRRSLILVSDNNFAPAAFTQFLLFSSDDPGKSRLGFQRA